MRLTPLFSAQEIATEVARLADEISADYADDPPILIGILKGSVVFLADLIRAMTIPAEVDFMRARSYGKGMHSSGSVQITKDIETVVEGRHVVVVEDISDTGLTVEVCVERIKIGRPNSVVVCALLAREGTPPPRYTGFWIAPGFVVGYGIDYAEQYRGLPDICVIEQD